MNLVQNSFNVTIDPQDSTVVQLEIQNTGGDSLVWKAQEGESGLIISEISTGVDYIEIFNKGNTSQSLYGYQLAWLDDEGSSNTWTLPNLTIQPGKAVAFISGFGTNTDSTYYTNQSTYWYSFTYLSVNFLDDQGASVDYFKNTASFTTPSNAQWSGSPNYFGYSSYYRATPVDADLASDWLGLSSSSPGSTPEFNNSEALYLSTNPFEGVLYAGASQVVDLTVSSGNRQAGIYYDTLWVSANSQEQASPVEVVSQVNSSILYSFQIDTIDLGTVFVGDTMNFSNSVLNSGNDALVMSDVSYDASQLTVQAPSSVPEFSQALITGVWIPLDTGIQVLPISVTTNATSQAVQVFYIAAEVRMGPVMNLTYTGPTQFNLSPGEMTQNSLTVENTGDMELIYSNFISDDLGDYFVQSSKSGEISAEWQDISSTGTVLSGCDDCYRAINLSQIALPFYDSVFTTVYVNSNGPIDLGTPSGSLSGNTFPSFYNPDYSIAAIWQDLYPNTGDLFYQEFADRLIVQFNEVDYYSGGGTVTFQYVFHQSGQIDINYLTLSSSSYGPRGMQESGDKGQAFLGTDLNNSSLRILKSQTWLTTSISSDTLAPGEMTNMVLSLQPEADLAIGQYQSIMIHSNTTRPEQDSSMVFELNILEDSDSVQVTLESTGPGVISPIGELNMAKGEDLLISLYPNPGVIDFELTLDGEVINHTDYTYTLSNLQTNHLVQVEFIIPVGLKDLEHLARDWSLSEDEIHEIELFNSNGQLISRATYTWEEFEYKLSQLGLNAYFIRDLTLGENYGVQAKFE